MPCAKGMTGCHRLCAHRAAVQAYQAARLNAEQDREATTRGWRTEMREHPPILTFRDWLIQTAHRSDQHRQEDAA